MSRKILSLVQTDVGRKRQENEDNFVWINQLWDKPEMCLIGAIDGVGGYEGGAEAALITKNTIEGYLQHFSFGSPLQLLKEAIISANNKIHEKRTTTPDLSRMSCVLSVAILDAEKEMMYIGHVGDSRGYIFRNGAMLKITRDHSTVGMKEDSGYLTEEEAMHHPRRNEINKMLGEMALDAEDSEHYIDIGEHSFLAEDITLFCSDGLTDLVTQLQMIAILEREIPLSEKSQLLIDKANELGGKDNITVALATYSAKKSDSKKIYKRAIEVPIQDDTGPGSGAIKKPLARKKKGWLLLIPLALVIGFLANWWGTPNLFRQKRDPVRDSLLIKTDTLGGADSMKLAHDSLKQATDTIFKDTTQHSTIGY